MMSVVKTASTTHPVQTFNPIAFFASKVIGIFFDMQKCVFIHSSGQKKDLSLERIRWLAHCRTTLFPRPSGLHYELENDTSAE